MQIIDAQVHAYERDHPGRPWHAVLPGPSEVTGDDMIAAMDAVGVDGAILVSPATMYQFDASYALEVWKKHAGRFGVVKPLNAADPAIGEVVAEWAATPGTVGVRLMLDRIEADDAGMDRALQAAAKAGMPCNVLGWGHLDRVAEMAARNPDTQIVLDHLGLKQPFFPPRLDAPWEDLPAVLALAEKPNVAIKITGACTLSSAEFPFADIWDPLARICDASGLDRCLWGTDWTRATNLITYNDGVEPFRATDRLSDAEKATLMGGTCARIYGWAPGG